MRNVLFVLICCFFAAPVYPQDEHPIDAFQKECIGKDWSTAGMNNCAAQACDKWQAEMDKNYNLLMGILDEESQQQLEESQAAWLQYKELETKFETGALLKMEGTLVTNLAMAGKLYIVKKGPWT